MGGAGRPGKVRLAVLACVCLQGARLLCDLQTHAHTPSVTRAQSELLPAPVARLQAWLVDHLNGALSKALEGGALGEGLAAAYRVSEVDTRPVFSAVSRDVIQPDALILVSSTVRLMDMAQKPCAALHGLAKDSRAAAVKARCAGFVEEVCAVIGATLGTCDSDLRTSLVGEHTVFVALHAEILPPSTVSVGYFWSEHVQSLALFKDVAER